ncbi:MAG TPA: amidohydrolase family protein [Pirellulales bacterium]
MIREVASPDAPVCDILIRNGQIYDGTGRPPERGDLAIRGQKVLASGKALPHRAAREIDAGGGWIMPGMLDVHTHYDAEIEALPGLEESVRHGVTSVVMGNCSLSTALGTKRDLLDLFCRVESLPRDLLSKWLGEELAWRDVREYYEHLDKLAIGPNVSSFVGHSSIRAHVMGMERSLTVSRPEPAEICKMQGIVDDAMQSGYLGLSIDMLPWHRLDGERFKGISVPSQHATSSEYRSLAGVVRKWGRVLQATPNALTKSTVAVLAMLSSGVFRKPLRTTIVAAMDVKTNRSVYKIATVGATVFNRLFRSNIRWQTLAEPFLNYCDGVHTPLFEEFPTGVDAITATPAERHEMFRDPKYRAAFRRDWETVGARIFHRDLDDMFIVSCPLPQSAGKSFKQLADEAQADPLEYFLDLIAEHDDAVRWRTVVTNDRDAQRQYLFAHDTAMPGFNDSGAHNRNMAFQDGGLQMLHQVVRNPHVMSVEHAIHKLTKETADWMGIETGSIRPGDWADVVVIDPEKLRAGLGEPVEHTDERIGTMRMVKRTDGVVRQVLVGGRVAFDGGKFAPEFGQERFGRLLRSKH